MCISQVTMQETYFFILPLQIGSVGFWVDPLFQVVAEIHQHLLHNTDRILSAQSEYYLAFPVFDLSPKFC